MTPWLPRWFACLMVALPFVPAVADDPDDKDIARLVKQLDSAQFKERAAATKRLKEIGEPALAALAKATSSLEVRCRAAAVIAVIENKICVEQLCLTGHRPNANYNGRDSAAVLTVFVSADGKRLLTGDLDKTLRLWDAGTGKELRVFEGHTHAVTGAALSPDGKRVLSSSGDNSVRLWDAATGKELHQMAGSRANGVISVAFGPEGQALSGGGDGMMHLWDLNTGKKAGDFTCHPQQYFSTVATVAYSARAKLAATSGLNQPIRLWNLETGKEVRQFARSDDALVCFSPAGKRLAACYERTLRIWDVATGKELLRIDPRLSPEGKYETNPYCIAFSPDGKRLVSGGYDNTVRVWDAATGEELRKYAGHTGTVVCVTFFPDGQRIASASNDGTARVWRAPR